MITKDQLEKLRTPSELKNFFDDLIQKITEDTIAKKEYRLNKGLYKYVKHELYPLVFFASERYSDKYYIRPIIGNQGYDAEVQFNNKVIDKIELTWAIDGKESHKTARQLNEKGYTEVTLLDNRKQTHKSRCLSNMRKKAEKDYSDNVLVIVYDADPTFSIDNKEDQEVLRELMDEARKIPFKAKKVFLFFLPQNIKSNTGYKNFRPISRKIK